MTTTGSADRRDRVRGALVGLATGDAVGTTVEFMAPGTFRPVTDVSACSRAPDFSRAVSTRL